MYFNGTYFHNLDPRNRVFIPADFREGLGEKFFMFKHPDGCIGLYTEEAWNIISERLAAEAKSKAVRNRNRSLFFVVTPCNMDKQGRITLPTILLEHAKIEKEVAIMGAREGIEIWNPDELMKEINTVPPEEVEEIML